MNCIAHSQTPAFFDYDNDGDLDLFVNNTARWTTESLGTYPTNYYLGSNDLWSTLYDAAAVERNSFFRNNGDGTFTEVTRAVGLLGSGWSGAVAVFDCLNTTKTGIRTWS